MNVGNLEQVILFDDSAEGKGTGIVDLVLAGDIDQESLQDSTKKLKNISNEKSEHWYSQLKNTTSYPQI